MLQGSSEITKLEAKKKKHKWSVQIMRELLKKTVMYEYENDGSSPQPRKVDETRPYDLGDGGRITYSDMEELQENSQQMTKNDQVNTGEVIKNKDGEGNAMKVSSSI